MKLSPSGQRVDQPTQIQDEGSGYFTMIPNIVFVIGLSPTAGWVYAKLKWKAGAELDALPSQEARISKLIGVSRSVWNRESKELRHFGLIRVEGKNVILTYVDNISWRYFRGKITLNAARLAVQALGEKGAKDIKFGAVLRKSGPVRGQKSGPERGRNPGPVRGHMINNMKTKNMAPSHRRPKVPTGIEKTETGDDDKKHLSIVQSYFEKLSNGGQWRDSRDLAAYEKVKHCSPDVIACGLCYSVTKSPEHRITSFGYAVNVILDHAKTMAGQDAGFIAARAGQLIAETEYCIEFGKWTVAELGDDEFRVMRAAGRKAGKEAMQRAG